MNNTQKTIAKAAYYNLICYGGANLCHILKYLAIADIWQWHTNHASISEAIKSFLELDDCGQRITIMIARSVTSLAEQHRKIVNDEDSFKVSMQLHCQATHWNGFSDYVNNQLRDIIKGKNGLYALNHLFMERRKGYAKYGKKNMIALNNCKYLREMKHMFMIKDYEHSKASRELDVCLHMQQSKHH